jgi:phage shock protein A
VFEDLRARIEQFLAQHTPPADPREHARLLERSIIDMKVAVATLRDGVADTTRDLERERRQLADAGRRGRLAREIDDQDTASIADDFVARHTQRVTLLERKLSVQHDELMLAEQELDQLTGKLRHLRQGMPSTGTESAWREVQAAGGSRPGVDPEDELLSHDLDRSAHEAAAEAQLAHLKRKLGRDRR